MARLFDFESDFKANLKCIPMIVRIKLDTCGVKLKLGDWAKMSLEEREHYATADCESAEDVARYRDTLLDCVDKNSGHRPSTFEPESDPAWFDAGVIPDEVQEQAKDKGYELKLEKWAELDSAQRFALIKLSRPGHENKNFIPACEEFGISKL